MNDTVKLATADVSKMSNEEKRQAIKKLGTAAFPGWNDYHKHPISSEDLNKKKKEIQDSLKNTKGK